MTCPMYPMSPERAKSRAFRASQKDELPPPPNGSPAWGCPTAVLNLPLFK